MSGGDILAWLLISAFTLTIATGFDCGVSEEDQRQLGALIETLTD